jgi:hypothetical protein
MGSWSFLSDHNHVLQFLSRTPGMKMDDIAASLGVTKRSAHAIVTHELLPEPMSREKTFREVLALFTGTGLPPA